MRCQPLQALGLTFLLLAACETASQGSDAAAEVNPDAFEFDAQADASRDADTATDATQDAPKDTSAPQDTSAPSDAGVARIEHVVVIGIDGLGGAWMTPTLMPTVTSLASFGTRTAQMQNALPTTSSTNWMSMISGAHPELHGVLSNTWSPGDSTPPATMFRALHDARPSATIGIFHEWAGFGRLVETGAANRMMSAPDADATMSAAIAYARAEQPTLLFVHLDLVDHAGHGSGWGTPTYEAAVMHADALVGQMREALVAEGLWSTTALLVSSDHGGVGVSHGADTRAERATPFVLVGPGISVAEVTREVRIWDIAPTVLRMLDVPAPPAWIASPVIEAFGGLPASETPTEPLALQRSTAFTFAYDETGTGALGAVSVWHPVRAGSAAFGDIALAGHAMPTTPAWVTSESPAVRRPVAYELIWNDVASGGTHDGSLWSPIPPLGFVCLGDVAVAGYTAPPLDAIWCVHQAYVATGEASLTWTDRGSGATLDGTVWSCATSADTTLGTFYTRRHGSADPGSNRCHSLRTSRVVIR